jgi:hypothetical protein
LLIDKALIARNENVEAVFFRRPQDLTVFQISLLKLCRASFPVAHCQLSVHH